MIQKTLLYVLFLIQITNCYAQDSLVVTDVTLSNSIDTLLTKKVKQKFSLKNYLKKGYPSPKKAVTLAVLPGLGQIYNKDYWKLPIVYLSLGGVIYSINYNRSRYELYRKAYDAKRNSLPVEDPNLSNLPEAALKSARDVFDKRRQLSWMGLFGFYLVSAGEAFVDAHLKDFNVSDDISFHPNVQSSPLSPATIGVSLKIKLQK